MLGVWITVIVAACIIEAATQLQLVSIWAAFGGVASLVCEVCGVDSTTQIILFFAVTFAALIITRPLIRKLTKNLPETKLNADMNIGRTGKVTKIVDESAGLFRVSVEGEDWSAVTTDKNVPEIGSSVRVERIEGVKLIVSAV